MMSAEVVKTNQSQIDIEQKVTLISDTDLILTSYIMRRELGSWVHALYG